jgi:hypothetical protein
MLLVRSFHHRRTHMRLSIQPCVVQSLAVQASAHCMCPPFAVHVLFLLCAPPVCHAQPPLLLCAFPPLYKPPFVQGNFVKLVCTPLVQGNFAKLVHTSPTYMDPATHMRASYPYTPPLPVCTFVVYIPQSCSSFHHLYIWASNY